jgi:hypothetical protein
MKNQSLNPRLLKPLLALFLLALTMPCSLRANEVVNGDFEGGLASWTPFRPDGSEASEIEVVPDPDKPSNQVLRLASDAEPLRFSVASNRIFFAPGEKFLLKVRYRPESAISTTPNTPGFLVRLTALDSTGTGMEMDHLHIDVAGAVHNVDVPLGHLAALQPEPEWKTFETKVTMPQGVSHFRVDLFSWRLQGAILIDDVVIQKLAD